MIGYLFGRPKPQPARISGIPPQEAAAPEDLPEGSRHAERAKRFALAAAVSAIFVAQGLPEQLAAFAPSQPPPAARPYKSHGWIAEARQEQDELAGSVRSIVRADLPRDYRSHAFAFGRAVEEPFDELFSSKRAAALGKAPAPRRGSNTNGPPPPDSVAEVDELIASRRGAFAGGPPPRRRSYVHTGPPLGNADDELLARRIAIPGKAPYRDATRALRSIVELQDELLGRRSVVPGKRPYRDATRVLAGSLEEPKPQGGIVAALRKHDYKRPQWAHRIEPVFVETDELPSSRRMAFEPVRPYKSHPAAAYHRDIPGSAVFDPSRTSVEAVVEHRAAHPVGRRSVEAVPRSRDAKKL